MGFKITVLNFIDIVRNKVDCNKKSYIASMKKKKIIAISTPTCGMYCLLFKQTIQYLSMLMLYAILIVLMV